MSDPSEPSRSYNDLDIKLLWGLAAARCAYPGCRQLCAIEGTPHNRPSARRGRIAHIVAHSDTGPRSDPMFPPELRGRYENLILLCATHHDDVDAQPETYPVTMLRQWKQDHELWVRSTLAQEMLRVSFAELTIVCQGIIAGGRVRDDDFQLTPPEEKMRKNGLSHNIRFLLDMGYAKVPEVQAFVGHIAQMDVTFPDRLVSGFRTKYIELQQQGQQTDALFFSLQDFAAFGNDELLLSAAGLAVLSYLFVTCEVFER